MSYLSFEVFIHSVREPPWELREEEEAYPWLAKRVVERNIDSPLVVISFEWIRLSTNTLIHIHTHTRLSVMLL